MSELVERMLEYQLPPYLMAEIGEAVDEVIFNTTAELFRKRCYPWKIGILFNENLKI